MMEEKNKFSWKIDKYSKFSRARLGTIKTPHGEIKTPAFIFCGTKASLKSFSTTDAKNNDINGEDSKNNSKALLFTHTSAKAKRNMKGI